MAGKAFKLEFETKRFLMRPYKRGDYLAWQQAFGATLPRQSDFDLEKKSAKELSRKEFLKFLRKDEKFRKQGQLFHFAIFEKKTGRIMGFILIALPLRFNVQSARISYAIFNNYWKHGFGRETVAGAVAFAFRKLKLHRLEAEILPANHRSQALVKSLGFRYEGVRRGAVYFDGKWHDHAIFSLLAEDVGLRSVKPKVFD